MDSIQSEYKNSPETDNSSTHQSTPPSTGILARIQQNAKTIIYFAIAGCMVLFVIQNFNTINIRFAWFEFKIFQFAAILGMGILGYALAKVLDTFS